MSAPVRIPIIRPTLPPFSEVVADLEAVWRSGMLTTATHGRELEQVMQERCAVPEAIGMANCTSGLILLLKALDLPAGGEVIVPSFTFAATAHAVVWNGLRPVFADCVAADLTLDPASVLRRLTPRTVAIMATTIFGVPPDLDALQEIADARGIPLVLDSAQALSSTYKGRPMGSFGVGEVFSMSPTKVTTAAEGGVVTTRDPLLAEKLRRLRDYGKARDGQDMEFIGLSARLSELHAVVACATLRHVDEYIAHRLDFIGRYQARLGDLPGISFPSVPAGRTTSCNYMVVRVDPSRSPLPRDALYGAFAELGIQTKKYFYPAVHSQTAFAPFHDGVELPAATAASAECLALPLYGHMDEATLDEVVRAFRGLLGRADA